MLINNTHLLELNSPNQNIKARVELYRGSTLEKVCNCGDILSDFTVEKTGEGKYFGFGICQKLKTNLIDIDRELDITPDHTIEASFGVDSNFIYPFPNFYVYEAGRDEASNMLTVTAYDALYEATNHTVKELVLPASYSIRAFATACANLLGIPIVIDSRAAESFNLMFENGANFDGTESIRRALNAVAEATQTIYYMDNNWDLVFKRLDVEGAAAARIGKDQYIDLQNDGARVLSNITHTTELGDSVSSIVGEATEDGVTQFIRDNPFWELREDIGALLDEAQAIVGGTAITQFECNWMGNYLLEIGDKIELITEDNNTIVSYIMDDTITFDSTLSQFTKWRYDENSSETAENPTTLGEALNKTFARVDKVNKRIDLIVSDVNGNNSRLTQLELTTDGMAATVTELQEGVETVTEDVGGLKTTTTSNTERIGALEITSSSINLKVTEHEEKIKAFEELETGQFIDRVAQIEIELDGIESTVSRVETEAGTAINTADEAKEIAESASAEIEPLATRVSTAETKINQNTEAIGLRATKEEVLSIEERVISNTSSIGALQVNTESISASVESVRSNTEASLNAVNDSLETLFKKTELMLTEDDVRITIESELSNGAEKVATTTGYTFDENGLSIHKDSSDITTQITEDGMTVKKDNEDVLTANSSGVNAVDLHASTFLSIGGTSRFENFEKNGTVYTACFWL